MRTVSLVNRLRWSFGGNMNPHALVVGDADNDGDNEFVIGNLNGDLAIFKGDCSYGLPTYFCRGLGTITCLAIGDARNCGKNSVVCINAEGHAHIFDMDNLATHDASRRSSSVLSNNQMTVEEYLQHSRRGSDTTTLHSFRNAIANAQNGYKSGRGKSQLGKDDEDMVMQHIAPNHTVKVPVNVNKIIIADIDGDGRNEVVLARTDRILHSFELKQSPVDDPTKRNTTTGTPSTSTSTSSASTAPNPYTRPNPLIGKGMRASFSNITQSSLAISKDRPLPPSRATTREEIKEPSTISKISTGWGKRDKSKVKSKETLHPNDADDDNTATKPAISTTIIEKDMWIFDGQITSLSTTAHPNYPNEPLLLVAQPGNTFTIIDQKGDRYNPDFTRQYVSNSHYRRSNDQVGDLSTYQFDSPEISQRPPNHSQEPVDIDKASMAKIIDGEDCSEEMYGLSVTPKATQWMTDEPPMAKTRRLTSGTIRPLLRRASSTHAIGPDVLDKNKPSLVSTPPVEIKSSSYVVQSWPLVDGDDVVGDEIKGLVATEIVMGKRRHRRRSFDDIDNDVVDDVQADVVGMLSMDGKFTVYNLLSKERSEYDLFVTHKLFSLATLNTRSNPLKLSKHGPSLGASGRNRSGLSTPAFSSHASSPQLKFPSPYMRSGRYNSSATASINDLSSAPSPVATTSVSVSENGDSDMEDDHSLRPVSSHDDITKSMGSTISKILGIMSGSQADGEVSAADGDDELEEYSDSDHNGSRRGSEYNGLEDSWISEQKVEVESDLFVACAWNGVTYMIDWSQRGFSSTDKPQGAATKFQLVKFAFEGRVCAFTAGSYAIVPGQNVPCLFYVDFDDQIYVYYDVRISPGPVTNFLDEQDDDIEEALERIDEYECIINDLQQRICDPDDNNDKPNMDNPFGSANIISSHSPNELPKIIHRCLYELPQLRAALSFELEQLALAQTPFQASQLGGSRRLSDIDLFQYPSLEGEGEALSDGIVRTPSSMTSPVAATTPSELHDRDHELLTDSDLADTEPDEDSMHLTHDATTITTNDTL